MNLRPRLNVVRPNRANDFWVGRPFSKTIDRPGPPPAKDGMGWFRKLYIEKRSCSLLRSVNAQFLNNEMSWFW